MCATVYISLEKCLYEGEWSNGDKTSECIILV